LNVLLRLIERWTHFMSSNHGGRYVYHEVTRRFYEPLFLYHVIKRN
jgi:hypothetical protein